MSVNQARHRRVLVLAAIALVTFTAASAAAQTVPEAPAATAAASAPVFGSSVGNAKVFNSDMAVIGDFLGAAGRNVVRPDPFGPGTHPNALQLHESEAAFQAVVDPIHVPTSSFRSASRASVVVHRGSAQQTHSWLR